MLRPAVGIAAVVCACFTSMGCALFTGFLPPKSDLGGDPVGQNWEKVKTPGTPKIPAALIETTERVELLGRRIIAQNVFTGLEPAFVAFGIPETVLFHRGTEAIFISEGLVKKCKTEAELAAVLCSELGQMMAEKRGVRRNGSDRDTIPDSALPGGVTVAGGTPADLGHDAEIAFRERRQPRAARTEAPDSAAKLSRDLLKGAGFDPAELDLVEPLMRQDERGRALRKQLSNSAAPPKWDN